MRNRIILVITLLCAVTCAYARVARVVIEQRESPAFRAQSFGKAGQFETLSGRFYGEFDPKDPHNSMVGRVCFSAGGCLEITPERSGI